MADQEHDPITQAAIDFIAKELREAFGEPRPTLTVGAVREQFMRTLKGFTGDVTVEIDANDPSICHVTIVPPKVIVFEFQLLIAEMEDREQPVVDFNSLEIPETD